MMLAILRRAGGGASLLLCLATAISSCKNAAPSGGKVAAVAADGGIVLPAPPDLATPPKDAQTSESGLVSKVLSPGTGKTRPTGNDSVKVTFTGWTSDGVQFTHGEGVSFHAVRAITGWAEALAQMVAGEKRRLWVPEAMAYEDAPDAPEGTLVFDLELLEVTPGPGAPPDVAAPPSGGLASKVVAPGTGKTHPAINDVVEITFASWTKDGKPLARADEVHVPVSLTMAAWRETLPLMVVGETRRLWVPAALAYANTAAAPTDTVVFDLTLHDVFAGPPAPAGLAPPPSLRPRRDGLVTQVVRPGSGRIHPGASDGVRVKYLAWQRDGALVASTDGEPVVRPVSGQFPGWTAGLRAMVKGETRVLWIPAALGPTPASSTAPSVDLTLLVELVDILPAPKVPPNLTKPPRTAIAETDGLVSAVLVPGNGAVHPSENSVVTVQYSAWTTDGKLIASTSTLGEPITVGVGGDVPGLSEALRLMVEGEKRRVWIPPTLANRGRPGAPEGPLVLDIELQTIVL